jgi:hypothetical protein
MNEIELQDSQGFLLMSLMPTRINHLPSTLSSQVYPIFFNFHFAISPITQEENDQAFFITL